MTLITELPNKIMLENTKHDDGGGGEVEIYPCRSCPGRFETPPRGKVKWWDPSDQIHTLLQLPLTTAWTADDWCKSQESQTFAALHLLDPPRLLSTPLEYFSSHLSSHDDENGCAVSEDENLDGDGILFPFQDSTKNKNKP